MTVTAERPLDTAYLAGGCFWGMEDLLRRLPGVVDTEVGYTGGWLENPRYDDTHDSKSGHAEAVKIVFDPAVLPFEELLVHHFFRMHDPTTPDRQGNDRGTQYRHAVPLGDLLYQSGAGGRSAVRRGAGTEVGPVVASDRHADRAVQPLVAGRGLPPGLPGALPERLHLPLHALTLPRGRAAFTRSLQAISMASLPNWTPDSSRSNAAWASSSP